MTAPAFPPCPENEPDTCRFAVTNMGSTMLVATPIYDRAGNRTDVDPNTYLALISCRTCARVWQRTIKAGDVTFEAKN